MDKAAIIKRIQQTVKKLPEEKMHEVADFADYLLHKASSGQAEDVNKSLSELDQASLNHLEDELRDYRKLYPHE
jgi:hypothetical protein